MTTEKLFENVTVEKLAEMNDAQFNKFIEKVAKQEENDDHLNDAERKMVIIAYLHKHPEFYAKLGPDFNENFCNIIF